MILDACIHSKEIAKYIFINVLLCILNSIIISIAASVVVNIPFLFSITQVIDMLDAFANEVSLSLMDFID